MNIASHASSLPRWQTLYCSDRESEESVGLWNWNGNMGPSRSTVPKETCVLISHRTWEMYSLTPTSLGSISVRRSHLYQWHCANIDAETNIYCVNASIQPSWWAPMIHCVLVRLCLWNSFRVFPNVLPTVAILEGKLMGIGAIWSRRFGVRLVISRGTIMFPQDLAFKCTDNFPCYRIILTLFM